MSLALKDKYLEKMRASFGNLLPDTEKCKNEYLQGLQTFADSLPIVNMPREPMYKRPQLVKNETGWYVWFEVEDVKTGKMKQFTRKAGINFIEDLEEREEAAYSLIDAINELLDNHITPFGRFMVNGLNNRTLFESMEYILADKKISLRPRSYVSYKDTVRLFKEFLVSQSLLHTYPETFTRQMAMNFGYWMNENKKYAGKTFNTHRLNTSMFFNALIASEIITKNPMHALPKRPENTQKNLAYSLEERKILREYFENTNPLLGQFCQFLYYLGIRPMELLQVQLRDIDLDAKRIIIYTGAAKNRRQEPVYMSASMLPMIESKNIKDFPGEYFLFGHSLKISERQWIRTRVTELHSAAIKELKLNSDHTLYSWKHSGAVEFYKANGKDPYKLMKHLRHTDITSTMKYIRSLALDYDENIKMPEF